jgi:bacterioferritin (cytochrome b1)
MNKPEFINKLNAAVALEYCAVIQYNQYANVLTGADRRIWHGLFKDMSEGALEHARKFGFRVAALGGRPTIEHAPVKQASNINEMLANAIELEKSLVQAYTEALTQCEDHPAYRNLLEDIIQHEQDEVDELTVYANKVEAVQGTQPAAKRAGRTAG